MRKLFKVLGILPVLLMLSLPVSVAATVPVSRNRATFPAPLLREKASGLATAINAGGYYNGIRLCGKVKIVPYNADIKVEVVNSFPDLRVKVVEHFPDRIGEWQFVEYGQDFTVQFVNSLPDIKIKYVDSFPGVN